MADGGELADVAGDAGRFAPGAEIAAAEQVFCGDDGSAHGAVLVSALGPGEVAIEPEMKSHGQPEAGCWSDRV